MREAAFFRGSELFCTQQYQCAGLYRLDAGSEAPRKLAIRPRWAQAPDEQSDTPVVIDEALAAAREKLYAARARRVPPLRDEKVLAASSATISR